MAIQTAYVLNKEIIYQGSDFFGRKAKLGFTPRCCGSLEPWFWQDLSGQHNIREINPGIVKVKKNRVELVSGKEKLSIYEHIGALRFFNLVGRIDISGSGWPPYGSGGIRLWNILRSACTVEKVETPQFTVSESVRYEYDGLRGDRKAFTEIKPAHDGRLTLEVIRSFRGIGIIKKIFHFPDEHLLEQICQARALCLSPILYYLSKTFSGMLHWPHHESILWLQEHKKEELIREIVEHAAFDTLGALSLLCRNGYFVGHVVSDCSGHEADIGAVRLANNLIVEV